jgi:hypothetical protein
LATFAGAQKRLRAHAAFDQQCGCMIENRLATLHRIKAALDDGAVDPSFVALPI